MRKKRAEIAQETLDIINKGWYELSGERKEIGTDAKQSIETTKLYRPSDFDKRNVKIPEEKSVEIEVHNETTLVGAKALLCKGKVGVLNFASAKNPGGGFMGGAQAQEESIARSSSLYPSLVQMSEMYEHNKSHRTYLYSDYMIYSPGVVVFRGDDLNLLDEPYQIDVLTSPAVNVGAILQNKPSELKKVSETMLRRMDRMLSVFVEEGIEHIVLGAWGCGVFRNDPRDVVSYFQDFIGPGGKYEKAFASIRFSVLDTTNRGTFEAFKQLEK